MSLLILLNGPLLCGKTSAVNLLKVYFPLVDRRCKDKLFELTADYFNLDLEAFFTIYEDRGRKETPLEEFSVTTEAFHALEEVISLQRHPDVTTDMQKLSVREAMIFVSEVLVKPYKGNDYFGKARADNIQEDEFAIDDSAGFADELPPVIDKIGQDNIMLIRIKGRGEFSPSDSRGFIPDGIITNTFDVDNSGTEKEFSEKILRLVATFHKESQ